MHFAKQCVLCLIGLLILDTVFVHGIDPRLTVRDSLRETADSKPHGKLHLLDSFDVDLKLAIHRKLLAPTSSDVCKWDSSREECRRDLLGVSRLMSSSEDTFVKYLANYPFCIGSEGKDSCVNKDQCYWSSTSSICLFEDFGHNNENSPCVAAAPATFNEYEANVVCQQQTSSTKCAATTNCRWSSDDTCIADYIKVYFGISAEAFFDEDEKIIGSKFDEAADALLEEFDLLAADFDWSELLDWDVPDTSCPRSATPVVCKYSNAVVKVFYPVSVYCSLTYDSPSSCNKDPRCSYSSTRDSCGVSSDTRRLAHANGIIAAADDLTNETDRDLLSAFYMCSSVRKQSECIGACQWSFSSGACFVSLAYEGKVIAASAVDNVQAKTDPVCLLFEQYASSGCSETTFRFLCERKRLCTWSSRSGCITSSLNIAAAALYSTTDNSVTLDAVFPDCSELESESQCT